MVLNENDAKGDLRVQLRYFAPQSCLRVWHAAPLADEISQAALMSGTEVQFPTAQTSGQSGTCKNWFTSIRPRSFAQGSEEISGLGTVPAVHTKVRHGIGTS